MRTSITTFEPMIDVSKVIDAAMVGFAIGALLSLPFLFTLVLKATAPALSWVRRMGAKASSRVRINSAKVLRAMVAAVFS